RNLRETASLLISASVAPLVLSLWPVVDEGLRFELWDWLPGISLVFELEPLGLLFASVAALLWPVTTLYAIGYMRGNLQRNQTRFYFFFALAIAAALWIAFSGNLVTLFIGYEILTLSTWPLVTHAGNERAKRGGHIYLGLLLTTSIGLFLPAIVWTSVLAGGTDFTPGGMLAGQASTATLTVLFALYMFGIGKAALFPFHRWLPS
ncbi:proton-conducting transporter membrane subunit, partial [Actinomadura adrarensis]